MPKMRQEDIRDVFGIGQNVLVRSGKDWVTRQILDITVLRNDTFCPHCGMPLLGEPRFWFKDCGNIGLEDVMAVEDIDPDNLKKSVIPAPGLVTAKEPTKMLKGLVDELEEIENRLDRMPSEMSSIMRSGVLHERRLNLLSEIVKRLVQE